MKYDVAYQEWLTAKEAGDFKLADQIREDFERYHGLTIFAEGKMPLENVTVRRMNASDWYKKYGNPKVGKITAAQDSKVGKGFHSKDLGYHY